MHIILFKMIQNGAILIPEFSIANMFVFRIKYIVLC